METAVALESLEDGPTAIATMYNYSKNGLYFESDTLLTPGRQVFLGIAKSPYTSEPNVYECHKVKIKWCKELYRSNYKYGYGVEHHDPPYECSEKMLDQVSGNATGPDSVAVHQGHQKDARKHPRKKYSKPVYFASENQYYQGIIGNISRGGLFVETPADFNAGQSIRLIIPGTKYEKETMIKGRIVHVGEKGVGVKFTGLMRRKKE